MSTTGHLWAVGFDTRTRAYQVRDEIAKLGWGSGNASRYILLTDIEVVVRSPRAIPRDARAFPCRLCIHQNPSSFLSVELRGRATVDPLSFATCCCQCRSLQFSSNTVKVANSR